MTVALNAQTPWNGTAQMWTKGEGTEADPYQIETAEHLAYLAKATQEHTVLESHHFKLINNLDLGGASFSYPSSNMDPNWHRL